MSEDELKDELCKEFEEKWRLNTEARVKLRSLNDEDLRTVVTEFQAASKTKDVNAKFLAFIQKKCGKKGSNAAAPKLVITPGLDGPMAAAQVRNSAAMAHAASGVEANEMSVRMFAMQWGIDDRSMQFLMGMPPQVRAAVIHGFCPPINTRNMSATLVQYARNKSQEMGGGGGIVGSGMSPGMNGVVGTGVAAAIQDQMTYQAGYQAMQEELRQADQLLDAKSMEEAEANEQKAREEAVRKRLEAQEKVKQQAQAKAKAAAEARAVELARQREDAALRMREAQERAQQVQAKKVEEAKAKALQEAEEAAAYAKAMEVEAAAQAKAMEAQAMAMQQMQFNTMGNAQAGMMGQGFLQNAQATGMAVSASMPDGRGLFQESFAYPAQGNSMGGVMSSGIGTSMAAGMGGYIGEGMGNQMGSIMVTNNSNNNVGAGLDGVGNDPTVLQQAIRQLVRVDLQQLKLAVGEPDLQRLVDHLKLSVGSVGSLQGNPGVKRQKIAVQGPGSAPSPPSSIEIIVRSFLVFGNARMLARLQCASKQWQKWADCPSIWRSLVYSRWPGTQILAEHNLASGDFRTFFRDRFFLETGRALKIEKVSQPSSSLEGFQLLVQLSDTQGPIFSGVLPVKLVDLRGEGSMIDGWNRHSRAFERGVEDSKPKLRLSLTAVYDGFDSGCKYSYLGHAQEPQEAKAERELSFSFPAHVPLASNGFFPTQYCYKCILTDLERISSVAATQIRGFKKLRLWCEKDNKQVADPRNRYIGCLKSLWDAWDIPLEGQPVGPEMKI